MKTLFIVTVNHFFGQGLDVEHNDLNIEKIKKNLAKLEIKSKIIDISELIESGITDDCFYWISSHQNKNMKKYLNDVVFSLFIYKQECLITSLELFFAHENKGIQSILYNKGKDINLVPQKYCINNVIIDTKTVFKTIDGSGSKGVALIDSTASLKIKRSKEKISNCNIKDIIRISKKIIKKIIISKGNGNGNDYFNSDIPFVIQDYFSNLKFDYKVLVFWDHFYVLKRTVRDNDFRASGSGKFEFIVPTIDLLVYCQSIRKNLNTPFLSLDIVYKNDGYFCIEYQGTHFGPYTQLNSKYFYMIDENKKLLQEEKSSTLEDEYAYSLYKHLEKISNINNP